MSFFKTFGLTISLLIFTAFLIDLSMHAINYFVNHAFISKELSSTLVASFSAAIISFTLLASWDKYKNYTYIIQKDELILNNISHELEACLISCFECLNHLDKDSKKMGEKHGATPMILPPSKIRLNIWELLKYHIPKYVKHQPDKLLALRKASNHVNRFNNQLNCRIDYQVHGIGHGSVYTKNIVIFDKDLIPSLNRLIPMIIKLRDEYEQFSIDARSDDVDPDAITITRVED